MAKMSKTAITPSLNNPFAPHNEVEFTIPGEIPGKKGGYEEVMKVGHELIQRPVTSVSIDQIEKQHFKKRMTVWERIRVLTEKEPNILFQNWGKNLDGASLVTGILNINGRDVAIYGHDFTVRAGSIDATNGRKLALLFQMAAEKGIPVIGMNDSAGAFVPAGVGSVLGEAVPPEDLGGPKVHGGTGVADLTVEDEVGALRAALQLLSYLPDNNSVLAPFLKTSDPLDRKTWEINTLLKKAFNSPTGFNTPFDVS